MATITTTMNQIKWTNTFTAIKMATGFYLDPNSQSQRITCYLCLIFYYHTVFFSFIEFYVIWFFLLRFRRFVALTLVFCHSIVWIFGFVFGFYYYHFTIVVVVLSLTAVNNSVCHLHYWFCFHLEFFSSISFCATNLLAHQIPSVFFLCSTLFSLV